MKARTAVLSLAALLLPAALLAADFQIDPMHSSANFRIRHLVSKVNGSFSAVTGSISLDEAKPANCTVKASIETATISTHNEARDKHLKSPDFFDVEKYPAITFASTKVVGTGKGRYRVLGNLTMHGVTRPVALAVEYAGQTTGMQGEKRAGFSATLQLNRKDYGVSWNKTLDAGGALLGDDVEITLEIEAVEKK